MSNNQENRLRHLLDLYDGTGSEHSGLGPDAEGELETLREMKGLLDARPKRKPDPGVVSAVLAAARGESVPHRIPKTDAVAAAPLGKRTDRAPVARQKSTVLRIGAASALVVLLLAFVGIFQLELLNPHTPLRDAGPANEAVQDSKRAAESTKSEESTRAAESEESAVAESAQSFNGEADAGSPSDAAPTGASANVASAEVSEARNRQNSDRAKRAVSSEPGAPSPQSAGLASSALARRPVAAAPSSAESDARVDDSAEMGAPVADALSWDQRSDVMEMYQHIEMIGGGVDQGWEESSVPLEMLPQTESSRRPFLRPAGQRRSPDQ